MSFSNSLNGLQYVPFTVSILNLIVGPTVQSRDGRESSVTFRVTSGFLEFRVICTLPSMVLFTMFSRTVRIEILGSLISLNISDTRPRLSLLGSHSFFPRKIKFRSVRVPVLPFVDFCSKVPYNWTVQTFKIPEWNRILMFGNSF